MSNPITAGHCSFKGDLTPFYSKMAITSALVLLVTAVAICVILAYAPIGSETFAKIGGYPLFGTLVTLGGISLISFAIFSYLKCKPRLADPAAKRQPRPQGRVRGKLSTRPQNHRRPEAQHAVTDASRASENLRSELTEEVDRVLDTQQRRIEELKEEIEEVQQLENPDIEDVTTTQAPLKYQPIFDSFFDWSPEGKELVGYGKIQVIQAFESSRVSGTWEQFGEDLQEAIQREILDEESAANLFRTLLPQEISTSLPPEAKSQEQEALKAEAQDTIYQLFNELIPICGKGYDPKLIREALNAIIRDDHDGTLPKDYYIVLLLPFFGRALQSMRAENGIWKEGVEMLFQQFIHFRKLEGKEPVFGYFLETKWRDILDFIFSILRPLENLFSDKEAQANRALIDFLCGLLAADFALIPVQDVQKSLLQRRKDLTLPLQHYDFEKNTVLSLDYTQELVHAFRWMKLSYLDQIEACVKDEATYAQKKKEQEKASLKKKLEVWKVDYLLHKFLFSQVENLIQISFFTNDETNVQQYVESTNQIFNEIEIFNPDEEEEPWTVTFAPSKPHYSECVILGQQIDLLWNQYKEIGPKIFPFILKLLERSPSAPPAKRNFSTEHMLDEQTEEVRLAHFEERADKICLARKEMVESRDALSVEEGVEDAKAFLLEIISIIQARHQDQAMPYQQLTETLGGAFQALRAEMTTNFLNERTVGELFSKSYFIHQAFWSAYPTQQERVNFANRFILLFVEPMKKMEIEATLFQDILSRFCETLLTTCDQSSTEVQEVVKFFPFFELIPLFITCFFTAKNASELRPFVSNFWKVPDMLKSDLQSLDLMDSDPPNPEESQQPTWLIDVLLPLLAPLNAALLSVGCPGKSTLLKAACLPILKTLVYPDVIKRPLNGYQRRFNASLLEEMAEEDRTAFLAKHPSLSKKTEKEMTTLCVNALIKRFEKRRETFHPVMQKWIHDHARDPFVKVCEKQISTMSFHKKVKLLATLDAIEENSLKPFLDTLVNDIQPIRGLLEPLTYFMMFGLYGSSGSIFFKSDQQHFQDFNNRLRNLYDAIYNYEIAKAIEDPEYVQNHLVTTFDKYLPKMPT